MRSHVVRVAAAAALAVTCGLAAQQMEQAEPVMALVDRIERDPLMAFVVETGNLAEVWDSVLGAVRRFVPDEGWAAVEQGVQSIDQKLGLSLRDDLLSHLGPGIAGVVKVPPIDQVAGLLMAESPDALPTALGQIGLVVQVSNRQELNRTLWQLLQRAGAELTQEGTLVAATFTLEEGEKGQQLKVLYGFSGSVMALGFASQWVQAALQPRPDGQRLADGADFARVRRQLDEQPTGLFYLNLPGLRDLVMGSQMVQGALSSEPDAEPVLRLLHDPSVAPMGMGASFKAVDGGIRRVVFGPSWMAGSTQAGIIAAIAIPNLLNAVQRGRQKRTLADMRTVATCVEAFNVDSDRYPSSNGAWVEVATLKGELEPVYVRTLPTTDGWGNPLMYRSDGQTYQLVSPGRDGELEQDWSEPGEPETITTFDGDLVYADGAFVRWPMGSG